MYKTQEKIRTSHPALVTFLGLSSLARFLGCHVTEEQDNQVTGSELERDGCWKGCLSGLSKKTTRQEGILLSKKQWLMKGFFVVRMVRMEGNGKVRFFYYITDKYPK